MRLLLDPIGIFCGQSFPELYNFVTSLFERQRAECDLKRDIERRPINVSY